MCWCFFIACALSHHSQTQPKNEKCWERTEWYIIIDWFFCGGCESQLAKELSSKKTPCFIERRTPQKTKAVFFLLEGESPYKQGKKFAKFKILSMLLFLHIFFYKAQPNKGVNGQKFLRKLVQIAIFFCAENVPKNAPVRQSNFIPNNLFPFHKIQITCQFVLELKMSHKLVSKLQVFLIKSDFQNILKKLFQKSWQLWLE